ncbi:hypothetical protein WDU94_000946 [Cyamophila willieti]
MPPPPKPRSNFAVKILRKISGPKCCIFYLILSIWGVLQLVLTAILFHFHSVALLQESLEHLKFDIKTTDKTIEHAAKVGTLNCIVAAVIYFTCGGLSLFRIKVLKRRSQRNQTVKKEYPYKQGLHSWYVPYDVGTRSNNKVGPQTTFIAF